MAELTADYLLAHATRFEFGDDPLDRVSVEWRSPGSWAVCWRGRVLNARGKWEFEPMPSSRTDAFKGRTRFGRDEAITRALGAKRV
jgi:hypothetical protein